MSIQLVNTGLSVSLCEQLEAWIAGIAAPLVGASAKPFKTFAVGDFSSAETFAKFVGETKHQTPVLSVSLPSISQMGNDDRLATPRFTYQVLVLLPLDKSDEADRRKYLYRAWERILSAFVHADGRQSGVPRATAHVGFIRPQETQFFINDSLNALLFGINIDVASWTVAAQNY